MGVVGRFGAAISGTRGIRRGSCRGRVRLGAFLMLRDTPAAAIWGEMRVALAQGSFTSLHARGRQHDPDCRNSIANSGIYCRYRGSLPAYTAFTPSRRLAFGRTVTPAGNDGVIDLATEQWHQISDPRFGPARALNGAETCGHKTIPSLFPS